MVKGGGGKGEGLEDGGRRKGGGKEEGGKGKGEKGLHPCIYKWKTWGYRIAIFSIFPVLSSSKIYNSEIYNSLPLPKLISNIIFEMPGVGREIKKILEKIGFF